MRIKVDTERCCGHARCIAVAPRAYVLNDDGCNVTSKIVVPDGYEEEVQMGAMACPERVIAIIEI